MGFQSSIRYKFLSNKKDLSKGLSKILGKTPKYYLNVLNKARHEGNRYLLISRNLSYSQYKEIKELPLFNLSSLKGGLIIESKEVRENPMGKICERTIGYEKKILLVITFGLAWKVLSVTS